MTTTLRETIPLIRFQYLETEIERLFDEYFTKEKNLADREKWKKAFETYLNENIRADGSRYVHYRQSETSIEAFNGRLFSEFGIQAIPADIRGFLCRGITTDIDAKNCHPTALLYVCKQYDIPCSCLETYVKDRDSILRNNFATKDEGKLAILIAMNSDKKIGKKHTPFITALDEEFKSIQRALWDNPEFEQARNATIGKKNPFGSLLNRVCCHYENKVITYAEEYMQSNKIELFAKCFDGIMVYDDHYSNQNLLTGLTAYVESKIPGMNMQWDYKEHSTKIEDIPEDWQPPLTPFQIMAKDFEKTHCKILSTGSFITTLNDGSVQVVKKQTIIDAYEHLVYYPKPKKPQNFIKDWIHNNPSIKTYDDVGVYPHDQTCPPNIFNLWQPFEMELIQEYTHNQTAVDELLNLMHVLCNHDEEVFKYFVNWTANLIQYPSQKSTCPIFISKEGTGKGTFMRFLTGMLGERKVLSTSDPSRDVWGQFNVAMQDAYLVDIEELERKDTKDAAGRIKALITEPTLVINKKGVQAYSVNSYHKILINSNEANPIQTSEDDRRKFIVRCSKELIKNREYWNNIRKYLTDKDALKSCYQYFKTLPDVPLCMLNVPIPCTEYHEEVKIAQQHPLQQFIDQYVIGLLRDGNTGYFRTTAEVLSSAYNAWCAQKNYVPYDNTPVKLGLKLTSLDIDGVDKVKSNGKLYRQFDLNLLSTKYEWKNEDTDDEIED